MAEKKTKEKAEEIKEVINEEAEEIKEEAEEIKDAVEEAVEEPEAAAEEAVEETETAAEEAAEDAEAEAEEAEEEAEESADEEADKPLSSTDAKRKKKAERREAKAARKAANQVEEKKSRPNNILLAILIFGVLIAMFAFSGGYRYFNKPASIEKYMEDNGFADMYKQAPLSEYTTVTVKAEGNDIKIAFRIAEDAPKEELKQYEGEDGAEYLKEIGASFLTSMKPETQGLSGSVAVSAKKGDESLNYVKMSYREAKKFVKEQQEKAEEEAEEAGDEAEDAAEEAEDAAEEDGE